VDELLPADAPCTVGGACAPPLAFFLARVGPMARRQSLAQTSPPAKPSRLRFLPPAGVGRPLGVYSYVCTLCERAAESETPKLQLLDEIRSDTDAGRLDIAGDRPAQISAPFYHCCIDHPIIRCPEALDQTTWSSVRRAREDIIPVQQSDLSFAGSGEPAVRRAVSVQRSSNLRLQASKAFVQSRAVVATISPYCELTSNVLMIRRCGQH
jgi:hypothetical protein